MNFIATSFVLHSVLAFVLLQSNKVNTASAAIPVEISYQQSQKPLLPSVSRKYAESGGEGNNTKKEEKIDLSDYANQLKILVDPVWVSYAKNFSRNYLVTVMIYPDESGKIISVSIKKSSGFSDVDLAALKTFKIVKTIPKPPDIIVQKGIEWDFSNF